VRLEPVHWTNVASELSQYTHLAVGPASGSVRSAELIRAANSHSNQTASLLRRPAYSRCTVTSGSASSASPACCSACSKASRTERWSLHRSTRYGFLMSRSG
jgi:hypothetical protein